MKVAPLVILLLLLCVSTQAQTAYPDDGTVKNGVYANPFFGFGYWYPKDWVVSDEAINERIRERAKEEAAKTGISREMKDTYLLFTVARYPRGQQPSRVNPTIIIIAEKLDMSDKPTGKDYLLSLRPLTQKRGMEPTLEQPEELTIGGFRFFRDNYSGEISGVQMRKSVIVTVKKGYALAFSFAADDEKVLEEMTNSINTVLPLGRGGNIPAESNAAPSPQTPATSAAEGGPVKNEIEVALEEAEKRGEKILAACLENCDEDAILKGQAISLPRPLIHRWPERLRRWGRSTFT